MILGSINMLEMCPTCDPDDLRRKLTVCTAEHGTSLSEFLLAEVQEIADRPTLAELMERLAVEEPVGVDEPPEQTIRRLRETG
jgi:antitoxin FitA